MVIRFTFAEAKQIFMETNNIHNKHWVSEAQKEVWEWKERLYEKIKDLPGEEQLKYIMENAKKTIEEFRAHRKAEKEKQ